MNKLMPRIALIHATPASIAPIEAAIASHWPAACSNLQSILDDSLSRDAAAAGNGLDASFDQRMLDLCGYAVRTGADAVLFTCSAFGSCIERCAECYGAPGASAANSTGAAGVPVLKPNEAMMEEAVAAVVAASEAGERCELGVLATFEPTIASITTELGALASSRGVVLHLTASHVPDAMPALLRGDQRKHDRLVAEAARALPLTCSLVLLSQYSMACAEPATASALAEAGSAARVLTSPKSAVLKLKRLLGGRK